MFGSNLKSNLTLKDRGTCLVHLSRGGGGGGGIRIDYIEYFPEFNLSNFLIRPKTGQVFLQIESECTHLITLDIREIELPHRWSVLPIRVLIRVLILGRCRFHPEGDYQQ